LHLAQVPPDAVALISVRPADLLAGDVGKVVRGLDPGRSPLRMSVDEMPDAITGGVPLAEVDRITLFFTEAGAFWLVSARRPLDRARVLRQFGVKAREAGERGPAVRRAPEGLGIRLVDDRTLLAGSAEGLEQFKHQQGAARAKGELAEELRGVGEEQHLVGAVAGTVLAELLGSSGDLAVLKPLGRARHALAAVRFGNEFRLEVRCTFADEDSAREGEQALTAARDLAARHLPELGEVLAERFVERGGPRQAREVLRFYEAAEPGVRSLAVERRGNAVSASLRVPGHGAEWAMLMLCLPVTRTQVMHLPGQDPPP
jgi:hypothetical protein